MKLSIWSNTRLRRLMFAIVLSCAGLSVFVHIHHNHSKSQKDNKGNDNKDIPVVTVEKVSMQTIFDQLVYPARILPKLSTQVVADADGNIVKLIAQLGMQVKKGTPLFVIENRDPAYHYLPQKIVAPESGVITSLEVTEGTTVQRGKPLATITDQKNIKIIAEVAVADLPLLTVGLRGELKNGESEKMTPVRIKYMSPLADSTTGTALCELEAVGANEALIPGMIYKLTFKVREHRGFQLAEHAIHEKSSGKFVRIVDAKNKIKYLPIVVLRQRDDSYEISQGLTEGMKVVVETNTYLAEDDVVNVKENEVASQ